MPFYTDSHAHLSSPAVLPEMGKIIQRAKEAHVRRMINICTDAQTLQDGLHLATLYPEIRNAGATTPHDVEKLGERDFPLFQEAAQQGKLVAIGETGLDYHYEHSPRPLQQDFLKRYFQLALSVQLPVIFHCREAFADLFTLADAHYQGPAVLHCFTGTAEEAKQVFDRGWYLSFSGIITFKKSQSLRDIAKWAPLSQLLIETDTPYLAPQKYRGLINEPAYLPETAQCLAEIKGLPVEEIARITSENASTFLNLEM